MNVQVAKLSLLNGTRRTTYPEMGEVAAKRGTLYVLMEVSAPDEEWDSISRKLVDGAIEAFVVHKGPDTASLKDIAVTINEILLETNATRSKADAIWAGVNVVFMREGEMYLLQAGPALTYIARGSSVTRFPKSIDSTVFAPLGEEETVDSRLAKFALQIDDIVAMTGSFLPSHVAEEKLNEVMRRGTVEKVTDGLVTLAQTELSSLVIQYEPTAVMVEPKAFISPTTTKQPIIPPKPTPTITKTPLVSPKPTPAEDKPAKHTMPLGGQRKDYSTNPPANRVGQGGDVLPANRVGHSGDAMSSNRGGQGEDAISSNPPKKSVAVPSVPEAKRTEPFAPPFGVGTGTPEPLPTPSLRERFGLGGTPPAAPQDEPADTFVALPPQEELPKKAAGRTRATPPPKVDNPADDVISGVARRVEPDEPSAPRPSRKKADTPRPMSPPAPMPPYATTQVATGSFTTAAAPDASPLLRQMGALLLALLSGLLGGVAQGVGWIGRSVAPRVASSGGVLDRVSDGFWWVVDEATMAGRRIMNQMLPGDRPDPARNPRQPLPTRGDGSAFLRTLVILIPLTLAIIAAGVWFFGDEENVPAFSANLNGEGTYESLVAEAQELINQAENVDPQTAQGLIERALPLLEQATPLAENEGESATIAVLRTKAESLLTLASTEGTGTGTAVVPNAIVTFATAMTSTELVYGANTVYLIDSARGALYRLLPEQPTANDLATIRPLLTAQERLAAGVTVGTPYQMTWIPAGGGRIGDGLLTLTQEGQMFDFDVTSSTVRQVAFAPVTGQIIASEGYGGNLYHLDTGNKQVWKYVPDGGGEYPSAPTPWLTATGQTQFGTPIDMAIDGYIFMLDQSGEVRRFQVGEAKAGFALDAVNPPLTQPVAMAKVPPEATDLFVADAQRVVRFDQNGRFIAEYRAASGQSWGTIRDIAVNETSDLLYVLSDTGVYWVDVRK
jgi:hypothetical protein